MEKLSHWVDPILVDYTFDIHDDPLVVHQVAVHGGRFFRDQATDAMVSTTVVENDGK